MMSACASMAMPMCGSVSQTCLTTSRSQPWSTTRQVTGAVPHVACTCHLERLHVGPGEHETPQDMDVRMPVAVARCSLPKHLGD